MACPMRAGFTLTFRVAAGGGPVAVADGPAECGTVHLTLNGKYQPDLQAPDSYRAAVLQIAGQRWQSGTVACHRTAKRRATAGLSRPRPVAARCRD